MKRSTLLAFSGSLVSCQLFSANSFAASPEFQSFLSRACENALPGSDFYQRCFVDSVNGDLSTDSEDSLNPTQSLSNATNALAETKARIKALQDKLKDQREKNKESMEKAQRGVNETFQMAGFSILINAENAELDHTLTPLERGYNTDSKKFQAGADYRLYDNWIIGGVISIESYDTLFDADTEGRNFFPGNSEGSSKADSLGISVFTTKNLTDSWYVDALLAYSRTDYDFSRIGLFQESSRTIPTLDVETTASTSGKQLAAGMGIGWDNTSGSHNWQWYARLNYQKSTVDSYDESGGAGFAMKINENSASELSAVSGVKYAYTVNSSLAVWLPQLYVEYEKLLNTDTPTTTSSFLADTQQTEFTVFGDEIDTAYGRAGASLVAVFPHGWTAFVSYSEEFSRNYFDQRQMNLGVRIEF